MFIGRIRFDGYATAKTCMCLGVYGETGWMSREKTAWNIIFYIIEKQ